jgi:hypothetical protein
MAQYKPLDLSFLSNYNSLQPDSTGNIAAMLLANSGWSNLSNATMSEIAQANGAKSQHRVSGISRVLDALSTPTYGIANAVDQALIAHQKDSKDSALSDLGKSFLGGVKGAGEGVAAGTRGAFGSDEQASNPSGKTRFGDVLDRLYLHMSPSEARDPANQQKVKDMLSKAKINQLGGNEKSNLLYPNGVSDKDVENYFKKTGILGIADDVLADPFNVFKPISAVKGIKNAISGTRDAATISDSLRVANNARKFDEPSRMPNIPSGDFVKDISGNLKIPPVSPVPAEIAPPIPRLPRNADKVGKMLQSSRIIEFPKGATKFNPKYVARTTSRIKNPMGSELSSSVQKELAKRILGHITANDPKWVYRAMDEIRAVGNGRDFPHTQAFLDSVNKVAKARNIPAKQFMKQLAVDLPRRIAADVKNMRVSAGDLVNSGKGMDVILQQMAKSPGRLKNTQADIAFNVIRKYQSRVLGNAAPTTERIPGAMNRAISSGRNARYSGPQQVNMFQTILHAYRHTSSAKKFESATKILQHIENYFINKGAVPFNTVNIAEGVNLPLSRVLRAIGPEAAVMNRSLMTKILSGDPEALASLPPETIQRIEALKAGEAMAAAPAVKAGIEHGKQVGDLVAKAPLSPARKIPLTENVVRNTKAAAKAAGGGEVGAYVAGKYIRDHFNIAGPVDSIYKSAKLDTAATMAEAARNDAKFTRVDPKTVVRLNRALSDAMQSPPVKELGKVTGAAARVADWFGARFNAAYGNADFRPAFLKMQASAYSTAAIRSRYLNGLRRIFGTDPDLWSQALKSAQGNLAPTGIAEVDELAAEIQKTMESLFGGSGIREGAMAEATVAARSRVTMNMLNANLKRFGLGAFKFTNSKAVQDASGLTQDYSKGMDWLKSWESWSIDSPYKFLHQIQAAVEYSARENIMFDELASRFGSFAKLGTGEDAVKYGINHPKFKGVYFTAEGARQGEQFLKMLKEVNAPTSKGLQHVQRVLTKFKAAVTIYWPAHHVNNLIGDTFMNWYAGVNSITPYTLAMKVMRSQKGQYKDIEELGMLTSPNALKQAIEAAQSATPFGEKAVGNQVIFNMRNGQRVTNDMVATAAHRTGILPSGRIIEDLNAGDSSANILDRIGIPGRFHGSGQAAAHALSETRDHFPRYAQFIDHLMKSSKPFEQAVEDAGNAVRKWHPDGLDTTMFERNVVKTVLPFYSWMRKAIPLAIEAALTSPGKIKAYPQLIEAIQIYNGITPEDGISQQFPTDQLFPDWMREKGIGPVFGGPGSYTVVNPSVPAQDVLSSIFTPKKTIEGYLNPMIKVPIESLQGHEMLTDQGIGGTNSQSYMDYFLKQTPVVSNIGRTSGQFGVSSAGQQSSLMQNILNLFGARMSNSGPYQRSAQFDLRDYLKSQRG